jgi:hypothetical protein
LLKGEHGDGDGEVGCELEQNAQHWVMLLQRL